MKAFLTCSFRQEDRAVIDWFHDLLEDCGLEVIWAEEPEVRQIHDKIYSKIDECDVVVALFTRRHRIHDTETWTVPPAVIHEVAISLKSGMKVAALIESGVPRGELGLLNFEGVDIPEFDRQHLDRDRKRFEMFIATLKAPRTMVHTYRYLEYQKHVEIYRGGYGLIRYRCSLECLGTTFESAPHSFAGGDTAKKGWTTPPLRELMGKNPAALRQRDPFFVFRLISAKFDASEVKVRQMPSSTDEEINFRIYFPRLDIGSVVEYEWAWGSPDIFPTEKKDLEPGQRGVDHEYAESSFRTLAAVEAFIFRLSFEEPADFAQAPYLRGFDAGGNICPLGVAFEVDKSALFTSFEARLGPLDVPGATVAARWIPR